MNNENNLNNNSENDIIRSVDYNRNNDNNGNKKLFKNIITMLIILLMICWLGICAKDYYNVSKTKAPKYCIKKTITIYNDGTVECCTGLGYKVYIYKRKSLSAIEFGSMWTKDRSNNE